MPESNTQTNNNQRNFQGSIEFRIDLPARLNSETDPSVLNQSIARTVLAQILGDAGFENGNLSIAIVDDPTIHKLNVQYLNHDYETDVLSFLLTSDLERAFVEGEVIASFDTAERFSRDYGWAACDELLLYLIHGTLHLTGMDDSTDELREGMRKQEARYLKLAGLERPAEIPDTDKEGEAPK